MFLLLCQPDSEEFLAILRTDDNTWGLPGGKVEKGENPEEAIHRESYQEIGSMPVNPHESYTFEPAPNTGCIVYMARLKKPFVPSLNDESIAFRWASLNHWPTPVHPQMQRVIDDNKEGFLNHARQLLPLPN